MRSVLGSLKRHLVPLSNGISYLYPNNVFRNLCHVTDDVIMGHVTKIGGFFFPKCSQINFRKSHGGIIRHCIGLFRGVRKFTTADPKPPQSG